MASVLQNGHGSKREERHGATQRAESHRGLGHKADNPTSSQKWRGASGSMKERHGRRRIHRAALVGAGQGVIVSSCEVVPQA